MQDPASLTDALQRHAIPLDTAAPESGPDADRSDLEPVVDAFGDANIIGLGEATHGTREFFQLKDRLIRYLVAEEGLRLVGMESNFAETMAIDRYITAGEGSALDAIENIYFWTWDTQEVVAMLEWLREFNEGRSRDDQVRFWGYDMQFTTGSAAALQEYLDDVAPEVLDAHGDTLGLLQDRDIRMDSDGDYEDRLDQTRELVEGLRNTLDEHEDEFIDIAGRDAYELAARHVEIIEQALDARVADHVDDDVGAMVEIRDRVMAKNVSWILDHSAHDRIALWAHNEHIRRGYAEGDDWGTARTMGDSLAESRGDDYYTLGFDFARGEFQAIVEQEDGYDLQVCSFGHPPEDSLTKHLAGVDEEMYFLNIVDCQTDETLEERLAQEQTIRSVGSTYYGDGASEHREVVVPGNVYDGLIFVQETTRAVPNERD